MFGDIVKVKEVTDMNTVCYTFNKRASLFSEHFKGNSILPGAFTIGLILDFFKSYKINCDKLNLLKVSFIRPIKPEDSVEITIHNKSNNKSFNISVINQRYEKVALAVIGIQHEK